MIREKIDALAVLLRRAPALSEVLVVDRFIGAGKPTVPLRPRIAVGFQSFLYKNCHIGGGTMPFSLAASLTLYLPADSGAAPGTALIERVTETVLKWDESVPVSVKWEAAVFDGTVQAFVFKGQVTMNGVMFQNEDDESIPCRECENFN